MAFGDGLPRWHVENNKRPKHWAKLLPAILIAFALTLVLVVIPVRQNCSQLTSRFAVYNTPKEVKLTLDA